MDDDTVLITVTGRDRPGLTSALCRVLARQDSHILDMEQVTIRGQLTLGLLVSLGVEEHRARRALASEAELLDVLIDVEPAPPRREMSDMVRHYVVMLGQPLGAEAIAGITGRIAAAGSNIERIVRLSRYPITSYELLVAGGDAQQLRAELAVEAAAQQIDVAVQRASLYRRSKRLIVMDVDSTLVQGEVIEALADRAGRLDEVAALTARAMLGELDFEQSLRERVRLLKGLPVSAIDEVRDGLVLTPGARTLVRTLKRLGYVVAIVSGVSPTSPTISGLALAWTMRAPTPSRSATASSPESSSARSWIAG